MLANVFTQMYKDHDTCDRTSANDAQFNVSTTVGNHWVKSRCFWSMLRLYLFILLFVSNCPTDCIFMREIQIDKCSACECQLGDLKGVVRFTREQA